MLTESDSKEERSRLTTKWKQFANRCNILYLFIEKKTCQASADCGALAVAVSCRPLPDCANPRRQWINSEKIYPLQNVNTCKHYMHLYAYIHIYSVVLLCKVLSPPCSSWAGQSADVWILCGSNAPTKCTLYTSLLDVSKRSTTILLQNACNLLSRSIFYFIEDCTFLEDLQELASCPPLMNLLQS